MRKEKRQPKKKVNFRLKCYLTIWVISIICYITLDIPVTRFIEEATGEQIVSPINFVVFSSYICGIIGLLLNREEKVSKMRISLLLLGLILGLIYAILPISNFKRIFLCPAFYGLSDTLFELFNMGRREENSKGA